MITYRCPYPMCAFEHQVDDTTTQEHCLGDENVFDAHARRSAETEAELAAHLDETHPGWDQIELDRLIAERATREASAPQ